MVSIWLVLLFGLVGLYIGVAIWALRTAEPDPDEESD